MHSENPDASESYPLLILYSRNGPDRLFDKNVLGTLGALVADQQILAEIESREYSLISSVKPTILWGASQFADFSVLHSPKFAETHKLGSTNMEGG